MSINPTPPMVLIIILVSVIGCQSSRQSRDNRFEQISQEYDLAQVQEMTGESVIAPLEEDLSGAHSVEEYLKVGLAQNPEIQEIRLLVESLSNRVPQAGSLPDPMLGLAAYPSPVQTASGQQEFSLAMNQKVPWRGKLEMRSAIAEQDVVAARAKLAEVELKVAEKFGPLITNSISYNKRFRLSIEIESS